MDTSDTANVPVKSVQRTIDLIKAVQARNGMTILELAEELGVARSTAHNHVLTLEREGYLIREGDELHVGMQFLDHGGFVSERRSGYRFVRAKVRVLADETGELCQFVVSQNGDGFVMFEARGSDAVETQSRVGAHGPLHQVPGGKAILATFSESEVADTLGMDSLSAATPQTITNPDELLTNLKHAAERGYATNESEHIRGLNALSVPVYSNEESVLGSICVIGPSHRLSDRATETEISEQLLEAANELELNVTYSRV